MAAGGSSLQASLVVVTVDTAIYWVALLALTGGRPAAGLSAALAYLLLGRIFDLIGPVRLHARELVAFSVPIVLSSFITMLLTRTDTIMLGLFRASDEVGLYTAMFPLATGMSLIIASFGYLYLPMASRLDANDKREEMGHIYRIGTKWVFVLTFPLFLVFVAFPGDVLALVYGEGYRQAAPAFVVLSVGTLSTVMFGRVQETLSALGHTVHIMLANLAAYVVNVALNLLLIPEFSYLGAAVTSALSFFLLNALVYGVVRLRFDLTPFRRTTLRTFAVLLLGVLPAALLLARWASVTLVTLVPALVVAGLVTVAAVALSGCLEPADRIVIDALEEQVGLRVPLIHRYLPE
jgi:O-antigen/teichoic acid export membrane protein